MKEIIRIPYPKTAAAKKLWNKKYGTNAYWKGKHHAERAEDARYWHALTVAAMSRRNIRKRPFDKPVHIVFYFNDRMDVSNHSMIVKMIEDGLKKRLIHDDGQKWVKGITIMMHDEDCIKVVLYEVDDEKRKN